MKASNKGKKLNTSRKKSLSQEVFRHWVTDAVRFCDTDASGHVNNTAYAAYFESGRVAFTRSLSKFHEVAHGWILGQLTINYIEECHYPASLRIGTRVIKIGNKSLTLGSAVFDGEKCLATADSVLIFLVAKTSEKIPERIRQNLTPFL